VPGQARRAREAPLTSAPDRDTEQSLLDAILASPEDDGPRAVYADWLQQRGDPRGEHIALQLAGARDLYSVPWARVHELERAHAEAWTPSIVRRVVPGRVNFVRGFITSFGARLWTLYRDPAKDSGSAGNQDI